MEDGIRIIHRDEHVLAVAKPAGMLVHRGMGASRDETFLLQAVRDMAGARLYPVHRLDRPTEGLVVFALDSASARALQESWQTGSVRKEYRAIVRGWMPDGGLRDEPLDSPDNGALQDARTRWKTLERGTLPWPCGPHAALRLSLLELEPLTGRWHQLRRHLARMGHPIAGDTTHGDRHVNHLLRDRLDWWRLHLEAVSLEFPHPATGERLRLESTEAEKGAMALLWKTLMAIPGAIPSTPRDDASASA